MNKKIIAGCAAAAAALVIGGAVFFSTHFRLGGHFYGKNAARVDVRTDGLSPAEYEALRARLPETEILWELPFQGKQLPLDTQEITVDTLTEEDVQLLDYLPGLKCVHAENCRDYDALLALQARHPKTEIRYQVTVCGGSYANDTWVVTAVDSTAAELLEGLRYLPQVTLVELTGALPPAEDLGEVMGAYPDVEFRWNVSFCGQAWSSADTFMNLTGEQVGGRAALEGVLPYLPAMKQVNVCETDMRSEDMMALADSWPDIEFIWEIEALGQTLRTDAEEINISGYRMADVSEAEKLLPYFPRLKKLIMSDCGIDNETMDAFNRRYEDVQIVWTVYVSWRPIRTDETWFMPFRMQMDENTSDLSNLRYCTEMQCIDAGHLAIKDIEFVRPLTKLRWLIIGDTAVADISPVENHTELVFFEMFKTRVTDYTPLLSCTGLEDLNLGYTYGDAEIIAQMTWLKNLWWHRPTPPWGGPETETRLNLGAILPDANVDVSYTSGSTDGGWRKIPNYFAMRDFLGVFYMDED